MSIAAGRRPRCRDAWCRADGRPAPGERGRGARAVALVPAEDVGQHVGLADALPRRPEFQGAPAGPHLRRGGDEYLHSASGQMTVPMSRPSSTAPGGVAAKIALKVEQRRAHLGDRGHHRGGLADRVAFSAASSKRAGSSALAAAIAARPVVGAQAGVEHGLRHRPIQQPGVEMAQP